MPIYIFQTGFSEGRDLRGEPDGWETGGDTSAWHEPELIAAATELAGKSIVPRDIPALAQTLVAPTLPPAVRAHVPRLSDAAPVHIAEMMTTEDHASLPREGDCFPYAVPLSGGDTAYIFDFGSSVIGGSRLDISAPAGTMVDVGYEEILLNDRLVVLQTNEHIVYRFADRFVLREGRQTVESTHERGFRFLQVTVRAPAGEATGGCSRDDP